MQPTESFSVPRRALDVEDYIDIVRRHKGWIFGPFLFTLVASVVGVYMWPNTYISRATIKVKPQQVPQNMVQSAYNQEITDRIYGMANTIESRSSLTTIINTFGLYKRQRDRATLEDVIDEMKKDIHITPVATLGGTGHQVQAFSVEFSYENRLLAMKVVEDLVSRFIDEYNRISSNQTVGTTQFLADQADQAREALEAAEKKLTEFRVQNNGRLPDQVEANRTQLNTLQANSVYYSNNLERATSDKLQYENTLTIYKNRLAELTKPVVETEVVTPKSQDLVDVERQIDTLKDNIRLLTQQYTDKNPDVVNAKNQLAVFEKKREDILTAEAEAKKAHPATARPVNPQIKAEIQSTNEQIAATQSMIEAKNLEIEQLNKDLKRSNDQINQYQSRIETIPLGQQQFDDLLRDRDMAKHQYEEKSAKLATAQTSQSMEDRKQGETLETLDAPSLPESPAEPKRGQVISIGAALGLMLGFVIAGAREMKDTSLKNLKDVRAYTQMTILGSIPLLENDFVVRRRRRMAWLGWTTACLTAVIVMSGSVVYYLATLQ